MLSRREHESRCATCLQQRLLHNSITAATTEVFLPGLFISLFPCVLHIHSVRGTAGSEFSTYFRSSNSLSRPRSRSSCRVIACCTIDPLANGPDTSPSLHTMSLVDPSIDSRTCRMTAGRPPTIYRPDARHPLGPAAGVGDTGEDHPDGRSITMVALTRMRGFRLSFTSQACA